MSITAYLVYLRGGGGGGVPGGGGYKAIAQGQPHEM